MEPAFDFNYHKKPYPAIDPRRPELSAKGKIVLITGGGKSIGKGITESFAIAGAKHIIILGRELTALRDLRNDFATKYPDTTISPYAVDITDHEGCKEVFEEVHKEIGPIDVMVLNAAYLHTPQPIESMDISDFWSGFEINVKANTQLLQLFCKACNPESATLINVSSYLAFLAALPFPCQGYSASKAAFDVVVGYLAAQKENIRCFTMHPGSVFTPMLVKVGAQTTNLEAYDDVTLPGNFAVYLASSRAEFLRGKVVECNWDVEDMERHAEQIKHKVKYSENEAAAPLTVGLVGRSLPPMEDKPRSGAT